MHELGSGPSQNPHRLTVWPWAGQHSKSTLTAIKARRTPTMLPRSTPDRPGTWSAVITWQSHGCMVCRSHIMTATWLHGHMHVRMAAWSHGCNHGINQLSERLVKWLSIPHLNAVFIPGWVFQPQWARWGMPREGTRPGYISCLSQAPSRTKTSTCQRSTYSNRSMSNRQVTREQQRSCSHKSMSRPHLLTYWLNCLTWVVIPLIPSWQRQWPYASWSHLKYSLHVLKIQSLLNQGQSTGLAGRASVDRAAITRYRAVRLKKDAMQRTRKKFIQPTTDG